MAHAVINPNYAYHEALCLSSFDDGNTRANTLYWISTRPGFDPNYVPQTTPCTPIQITTTTVSIGVLEKKHKMFGLLNNVFNRVLRLLW